MLPLSDEKLVFRLFQRDGHQRTEPHRVNGRCPYAAAMRRQQRSCPWCIAQDVKESKIAAVMRTVTTQSPSYALKSRQSYNASIGGTFNASIVRGPKKALT